MTERLYAQLDEAQNEMDDIKARGVTLYKAIDALVRAFAADHSCDADGTMEAIDEAIAELVDDAEGPAYRRVSRLEDEISNIEEADLRRSAPMVL